MKKNTRSIEILIALYTGEEVSLTSLLERYQVTERTIYRDIKDLREALQEFTEAEVIFNTQRNTYQLKTTRQTNFTIEEIVSISKILINSRAFVSTEIKQIIEKLQATLSEEEQKINKLMINDELNHYKSLRHQRELLPVIRDFIHYIHDRQTIQFHYFRSDQQLVARENLPVSLFFSEFYFYAMFYSEKRRKHFPYRLDRFDNDIVVTKQKTYQQQGQLNDHEYRERTHLMFSSGHNQTIKFKYWEKDEVPLDRFPNAEIIKEKITVDDYSIIQVEAYDNGAMKWFLSQGQNVEIIEPLSLVRKMQAEIESMLSHYQEK